MFRRSKDRWVILSLVGALIMGSHSAAAWCYEAQKESSLYDRLGGLAPISVVVSDFIDILVQDVVLNANPAVDAARERVPAPYLKYHLTAMVCQAAGGPCLYQGREMKISHSHLGIAELEWGRMVALFKEVLAKHKLTANEMQALVAIVNSTKADIVDTGRE